MIATPVVIRPRAQQQNMVGVNKTLTNNPAGRPNAS